MFNTRSNPSGNDCYPNTSHNVNAIPAYFPGREVYGLDILGMIFGGFGIPMTELATSHPPSTLNILLVDGDLRFHNLFDDLVGQKIGKTFSVHKCCDAGSAIKWLASNPAVLICAELSLPVIDGVQFLGMVHQKYPVSRLCLLTSRPEAENFRRPNLRPGACPFFQKPNSPEEWDALVYHLGLLLGINLSPPGSEAIPAPLPENTEPVAINNPPAAGSLEGLDEIYCFNVETGEQESHGIAQPNTRRQVTDLMLIQRSILAKLGAMGSLDYVELEDEQNRALLYLSGDACILAKGPSTGMAFGDMIRFCDQVLTPPQE